MFEKTRSLLTTAKTRAFLDNWQTIVTAKGDVPGWQDIDPAQIHKILPDVWLYERLEAEDDYLCRLAGDEIIRKWDRKMMNRRFTEYVDPAVGALMMRHMNRAIDSRGLAVGLTPTANNPGWYAERVYGPVRRGDSWCVFGCSVYVVQHRIDEFRADIPIDRYFLFDAVDGTPIGEERY